jgi:hypothetical protein
MGDSPAAGRILRGFTRKDLGTVFSRARTSVLMIIELEAWLRLVERNFTCHLIIIHGCQSTK